MFDGYTALLPIQGAIVALTLLPIALVKVLRGARGPDAVIWNTIGIVSLLYLFSSAAWFALGQPIPQ
jgi:hypothetical protein